MGYDLLCFRCIAKAWALIRGLQTEDIHLFEHFIHVCENHGIYSNILPSLCEVILGAIMIFSLENSINKLVLCHPFVFLW